MANNQIDYSKEYFTIEALEDGIVSILNRIGDKLYYSINNSDWIERVSRIDLEVKSNDKIRFKGNQTENIGIEIKCNVFGNIMSLLFEDDFQDKTSLDGYDSAFSSFFGGCNVISAKNLILPATTLAAMCYESMFADCTSLTEAPELPATTLANWCYSYMFADCTSLTEAPELPATTLAEWCYTGMFDGCSKLNYIKMLATDKSASGCLIDWVKNVESNGTFVKHPDMTLLQSGVNGIPEGWTVVDYNKNMSNKKFLDKQGLKCYHELIKKELDSINSKISALSLNMNMSISASPTTIEKNKVTSITVKATINNKPENFTFESMTVSGSDIKGTISGNVGTWVENNVMLNSPASKTYNVEALVGGIKFAGSKTVNAYWPMYYGFAAEKTEVVDGVIKHFGIPADGLTGLTYKLTSSAKTTYNMTQNAEGSLSFFILVPSGVTAPSTFSMGGAEFAMSKTTIAYTVNNANVAYTAFMSDGTYSKGKTLNIIAS